MSGHSKWSTIKRQKGINDAKRGKIFTKLSNAITIAVREGGGVVDPTGNPRLRLAVDAARSANMPRDNIERALHKAQGKLESELEEVIYEGFGPGGFSFIIEAITDNKQRTTPEIKNIIEKNGGTMGVPGSVGYQYQKNGLVILTKGTMSADDIFLLAADAGAEDIEEVEEEVLIYTRPEDLARVRDKILQSSLRIKNAELTRKPLSIINITDIDSAKKALAFIEKIEELDDIQKVYTNFGIPDSLLETL